MNAVRIPTPAQNDLILRDHAQRYAEIQALKRAESVARDACCDVAANDEAEEVPALLMNENVGVVTLVLATVIVYLIHHFWGLA